MPRSSAGLTLPRGERLRRSAQVQAVFQQGSRIEGPAFVALWRRAGARRVGFAVSRQLRGAARRNRARRRIREAYRRVRLLMVEDVEMVVVARPGAITRPFPELVEDMRRLAEGLACAVRTTKARA